MAIIALIVIPAAMAQVTTSGITGIVKSAKNEPLVGASILATHTPTGTKYTVISRAGGRYDLPNINAGGPYNIEVSYVGFEKITRNEIYLTLGETSRQDFELSDNAAQLSEVVVASTRRSSPQGAKGGAETTIGRDKMANLPTVGRNVSDFLRFVPQVKVNSVDGGVSIAGQNNRYNSFYIDGAVNNDVFGLAGSGTNGGQAGIAPISIDAIDQFQVVLSPYDASLGNFTGGGINAITRSGTNKFEGSAYYFFRNQDLSGKNPSGPKDAAQKLADFSNKTFGFRLGGPIIKNKLFFFISGEMQRDKRPQPFDPGTYSGTSAGAGIDALAGFLRNTYGYDPGGYIDNPETVEADRIATKFDWNFNSNNKISVSYRLNKGFRDNVSRSSSSTINFFNNGYTFPTTTHSGSAEWNARFKRNANNKLLITYTDVVDDRGELWNPFPRVTIQDGSGRIIFGTEEFSTGNKLTQSNLALFDVFKFYRGAHTISLGTDNEFSKSLNVFIRQNYGSYQFASVSDFINGVPAGTYDRSYSLLDPGKTGDASENAAAKFNSLRLGFFVNDEIKVNENFTLNFGVRADNTKFLTTPRTDKFFNDTAISAISQYYDLRGARSGQISDPKWSINPRIGFTYKLPEENITVRGGIGTFTGRVPLVWPGGVYNNNGISIAGIRSSNVAFRADALNQYTAADFGINVPVPSGEINLIAKDFKMNKVLRTSLAVDKTLGKGWKATLEGIFTKNINEIAYQSVNILPATKTAVGADNRPVYDLSGSFPRAIPMRSNGSNPYTGVYLLYNNDGKKGYSYNFSASIEKAWSAGWSFNASYVYGNSVVLNEGTSSQNSSQWRNMEAAFGRNSIPLTTSDFDVAHRFFAFGSRKFNYDVLGQKWATTLSLVYNGQSGSPVSYVMTRGMIRDYDNNEFNDLIYIPTETQINSMSFLPNTVGSVTYTEAQQREMYNDFIESDKYLKKHRGEYSERNGGRLPFTHVVDLKLQQDFNVKIGSKNYQLQLTYDVFNFTAMLNRTWGRQYFANFDQVTVIQFEGYASATDLTPRYRFTPRANGKFYDISDGVFNSSRWTSQVGLRLNF